MSTLDYRKLFNPDIVEATPQRDPATLGDDQVYVFDDEELVLAINVALTTERPLLVFGPPGSGKSSLASNIARLIHVPLISQVITSRTEAKDLLWRFDAVRRLSDAQIREQLQGPLAYCEKGALWQAFEATVGRHIGDRVLSSVVLLDEIDKADPDLPNALLVPLGSYEFEGPDGVIRRPTAGYPLVVITSNNERQLSRAFVRRCVVISLKHPTEDHLVRVAHARLGHNDGSLYRRVAELVVELDGDKAGTGRASTAEYLDAVRACLRLGVTPGSRAWALIESAVLSKPAAAE